MPHCCIVNVMTNAQRAHIQRHLMAAAKSLAEAKSLIHRYQAGELFAVIRPAQIATADAITTMNGGPVKITISEAQAMLCRGSGPSL